MNITTDPNLWAICGLVFLLGLLIGVFLAAGGRRKWESATTAKSSAARAAETERDRRIKDGEEREKEWRERDSLRAAAVRSPPDDRGR